MCYFFKQNLNERVIENEKIFLINLLNILVVSENENFDSDSFQVFIKVKRLNKSDFHIAYNPQKISLLLIYIVSIIKAEKLFLLLLSIMKQ